MISVAVFIPRTHFASRETQRLGVEGGAPPTALIIASSNLNKPKLQTMQGVFRRCSFSLQHDTSLFYSYQACCERFESLIFDLG